MTANLIRSTCRQLHSSLGNQLRSLPEYVRTLDALTAVQSARQTKPVQHPTDTADAIADDVAAAAKDGKAPNLEQITTRLAEIDRRAAVNTQIANVLIDAERNLLAELDQIAHQATPRLLENLHDQLRTTLTAIAAIPNRHQLQDADTAISLGRTDDYTTLRTLQDSYFEIRRGQATIYNGVNIGTHHAAAMLIRDQESVTRTGGWVAALRGGTWRNLHGELCSPDPVPWPVFEAPTVHGLLTSGAWLDWILATPDALDRAWVPTGAQLAAETRRLDELIAASNPPIDLSPSARTVPL